MTDKRITPAELNEAAVRSTAWALARAAVCAAVRAVETWADGATAVTLLRLGTSGEAPAEVEGTNRAEVARAQLARTRAGRRG